SMTRDRHDPDLELIGQGLANIIAPLFGGIVSTGVIARTAVSVQAGARTRMAALVHSGFLLLLMLLAAPLAGRVPQASLAAILVYSGIKMIEWHQFARVMQVSRLEAAIIAITTAVIVATDLAVGFQVGLLFSFVLAAMKLGQVHVGSPRELAPRLERCPAHAQLVVRSVEGPMFFASFQGLSAQLQLTKAVRYLVVDLSRVTYVDVTAAEGLIELKAGLARKGQSLLLSAPTPEVVAILARAELIQHGGEPWIFGSLEESFAWAHLHRLASPQPAARRKTVRLVHEPAPAV
ncbi:MAG: SulP family inorganic anion transporter, partial [Candidatus Wallbacteria bacterium]|nr:SulP family inorganic anion transporter [Candidatus Wallbacteria bacterium]